MRDFRKFQTFNPSRKAVLSLPLRFEQLESRRLLAGIEVTVFIDQDGTRDFSSDGDLVAANRLVYVDANRNGDFDAGEPIQVTNEQGVAFFEDLLAGDYQLGVLTNPSTQRQATFVRVQPTAEQVSAEGGRFVLAGEDLADAWVVDDRGMATPIPGVSGDSIRSIDRPEAVNFGGEVASTSVVDGIATLLVNRLGSNSVTQVVVEFDLADGSLHELPLRGLAANESVTQLQIVGHEVLAVVTSPSGNFTAEVISQSTFAKLGGRTPLLGSSIVASPVTGSAAFASFASLRITATGNTEIRLHGSAGVDALYGSITVGGVIDSMVFSRDGKLLFAAMAGGGVNVISVDGYGPQLEAVLADAAGPVSASSRDGRVVTRSATARGAVTVWDPRSWQPLGTSVLGTSVLGSNPSGTNPLGSGAIGREQHPLAIHSDVAGNLAVVSTSTGVFTVDLAAREQAQVRVGADSAPARVQFGVQLTGENSLPDASGFDPRSLAEDTLDQFSLDAASGLVDADGDRLWPSVLTRPRHGELQFGDDGQFAYIPANNFHGQDRAVLRVYDGLGYTDLVVQWQVDPVNDPPSAILVQAPAFSEATELGSSLGFVAVVDPDSDAEYRVTTSDPRFTVSGGQLYFSGGEIDYEHEREILLDISATDVANPDFTVVSQVTLRLFDVDEPPISLDISSSTVDENAAGASIGRLSLLDPEGDLEYEYEVSDDRFEVREGDLRLREGVQLDHESEETVEIVVTARSTSSQGFQIQQAFSIRVMDQNELPTGIVVSSPRVEFDSQGAVVGTLSVLDPDGDAYEFTLSDNRFEVVGGGVVKLRDDVSLDPRTHQEGSQVELEVTARATNGDSTVVTIPLVVVPPKPPHQNPSDPRDVNGDGLVTPLDALILINILNGGGGGRLPGVVAPGGNGTNGDGTNGDGEGPPVMPDVNGDGSLTPLDVLIVINRLNAGEEGEGEHDAQSGHSGYAAQAYSAQVRSESDSRRRRSVSEIDDELESLLDQLSRQRLQNG